MNPFESLLFLTLRRPIRSFSCARFYTRPVETAISNVLDRLLNYLINYLHYNIVHRHYRSTAKARKAKGQAAPKYFLTWQIPPCLNCASR